MTVTLLLRARGCGTPQCIIANAQNTNNKAITEHEGPIGLSKRQSSCTKVSSKRYGGTHKTSNKLPMWYVLRSARHQGSAPLWVHKAKCLTIISAGLAKISGYTLRPARHQDSRLAHSVISGKLQSHKGATPPQFKAQSHNMRDTSDQASANHPTRRSAPNGMEETTKSLTSYHCAAFYDQLDIRTLGWHTW